MYTDKLDGVIDAAFFERKSVGWRDEQQKLLRSIANHQEASQSYFAEGIQLMELARRAPELFEQQEPKEKRRLLDFALSNCTWPSGKLTVEFRQPFELLAVGNETIQRKKATGTSPDDLCPGKLGI
jgi:site-specific DNA recombinase